MNIFYQILCCYFAGSVVATNAQLYRILAQK